MNNEQFEARLTDEVITLLRSWLVISRKGIERDTYGEKHIAPNLVMFARYLTLEGEQKMIDDLTK